MIIQISKTEVQSGLDRVRYAEGLISQLPKDHDGRNTWLLNFGIGEEALELRSKRNIKFDENTKRAYHGNQKEDEEKLEILTKKNEHDLLFYNSLKEAGVDNWEGYNIAIDIMEGNV